MAKIKIICTEQERKQFEKSCCPSRFNPDWKDYLDCFATFRKTNLCSDCWAEYVDWETEKGETNG